MQLLYFLVIGPSVLMQGCSSSCNSNPNPNPAPVPGTIMQIQVTGQPVLVFDHTKDQQQSLNIPDIQITAWKEADGTVNLMFPHYESYRMRGPDLLHLTIDPTEIFSSTQSASQIPEDLYNYHHWLTGPYSSDGKTLYSLAHSEWYAWLLNTNDCNQVGANGLSANLFCGSWGCQPRMWACTPSGMAWARRFQRMEHHPKPYGQSCDTRIYRRRSVITSTVMWTRSGMRWRQLAQLCQ